MAGAPTNYDELYRKEQMKQNKQKRGKRRQRGD